MTSVVAFDKSKIFKGPFWSFRVNCCSFLVTLFPLIACAISALFLIYRLITLAFRDQRKDGYVTLDGSTSHAPAHAQELPDGVDGGAQDAEDATAARGSNITESVVSRPRAGIAIVAVEVLCLFGLVAINLAVLISRLRGPEGQVASIAAVLVWAYISMLACWRLLATFLNWQSTPRLWHHTASLYCLQWILSTVLFRSAFIQPPSKLSRDLTISQFALVTVLAVLAITTRRGNRDVLLTYEDGTKPSPEPLASFASLMTFSWLDPLIRLGYKRPLEIVDIWNVLPQEKASRVINDFRQVKKSGRLAFRLLRFFTLGLLEQQFWAVLESVLTFVPPLLLKAVLEYVENPTAIPVSTAWLYVFLLPIVIMANGVAAGQSLWLGRKICIMLRAIMVGEVYAKTLRRKAASQGDTDMNADDSKSAKANSAKTSLLGRLFKRSKDSDDSKKTDAANGNSAQFAEPADEKIETQVNSGTIINLMSVDSFKVAEISAYWHFLIPTVPIQLAIAITLLFRILGWSGLAGLVVMVAVLPLNIYFSSRFSVAYKRIMAATDARIHTTNEILSNVRIIKYFAWEERFSQNVHEKREAELSAIARRYILWTLAACLWYSVPVMITGFTFFLYTIVEGRPLYPSVAFTSLSLFNLLRYPLDKLADMIAHVLESKASVDRVEKFLTEDETSKYEQLHPSAQPSEPELIGFKHATLSWSSDRKRSAKEHQTFRLLNVDIKFRLGGLNVIAGPTGSGKTSLLMGLLGEMNLMDGSVHLPGGYDRMTLEPGEDGLTESVAYCAQQAWLVNDTIKQNILFASPYDEQRYRNVLDACALNRDLEILESGDATLVGEKGIVVSGGQKQRISLARALYSNARHVLLDDCLSAVDSHTAQHLFERCITGPLMFGRTCLLVTHNVTLCVPHAHHVVILRNGKIAGQGSPEAVLASGALGEEAQKSRPQSKSASTRVASTIDLADMSSDETQVNGHANGDANGHVRSNDSKPRATEDVKDANARTETKAEGSVDWRVIKLYLSAMGPWYFWFFVFLGFTLDNVSNVATNVWIRQWTNMFPATAAETIGIASRDTGKAASSSLLTWLAPVRSIYTYASKAPMDVFVAAAKPEVDNVYYLGIYALLAMTYILIALMRLAITFRGSIAAARKIHARLLEAVLRAKFKFFDTTPLGQITNRFSKDLQAVDQEVVTIAASMVQSLFGLIAIIILISVITPSFIVAGVFLTGVYVAVGSYYIRSSRDLKRLESVQRSPLYQQFGETLSGIVTIRAYGDERRFTEDNAQRVNKHNRPFIFLWAANRWLALRVDFAGALVSLVSAVLIVTNIGRIDAGAAGLSLTYALGFNENILWLVRLYAENEQNMNHVERIKNFLEVEQEAPQRIPETQPPNDWPSKGAVEFHHYSTRYRHDLEPVLRDLNFKIEAGEKVGIVGRTGAGKSSLAMALFRGLEADAGRILIDGVDISLIGLNDLRQNLTIVPQDPTLFTGTIRSNLDPFGIFTDEEIFTALRQVNLIDSKGVSNEVISKPRSVSRSRNHEALEHNETEATDCLASSPEPRGMIPFMAPHGSLAPGGALPVTVPESDPVTEPLAPVASTLSTGPTGDALRPTDTNPTDNANAFTNLASPVAESGSNLSQGQRQLLCLARALLAAPRVLVMDEATASIDYATDARIQNALRALRGRTLITVAHRLRTIVDYDQVLVLDRGCVVEFAPPWELIAREGGMFRGMCETSGDFEALVEGARVAEANKELIDFSGV